MPLITRVFLKTGLLYFIVAMVLGVLLQINSVDTTGWLPIYWHTLMLGWITQIIMGISLWMFPGRNKEESWTNQIWPWSAYILINVGLILRCVAEPAILWSEHAIWKILLTVSALLQFVGVLCYVREIWPRVFSRKNSAKLKREK